MSGNHRVLLNSEKCIGCGLCASDCVASCIKIQNGKATAGQEGCIACGHCEAVCPQSAIVLTGFEEESESFNTQTRLDPQELLQAIRTRRSIRNFDNKEIDRDIVDMIIEAGRLAPTGSNSQNTCFIVLDKSKNELEKSAVKLFQSLTGIAKPFSKFLSRVDIDDSFFFKKAPLVIVLTGNSVNASLAAENMAFMAEANGLGVLFSGFFTVCANSVPKIKKTLGMKRGEKAVTTLVIGYPKVKYYRTARREKARVRRV